MKSMAPDVAGRVERRARSLIRAGLSSAAIAVDVPAAVERRKRFIPRPLAARIFAVEGR
jgi:hypothetical protein